MENNKVEIKQLSEKNVAVVSFTGNYMGNAEVFKGLFEKLFAWAGPKGLIGPNAQFIASYQDDPKVTPPEELVLDLAMTIPEGTECDGEVVNKTLAAGEYAVMKAELTGPEEYGPAWGEVVKWMEENNYVVDMSRPSYEIYLNNPEDHPEKHHILEICMSVKTKE